MSKYWDKVLKAREENAEIDASRNQRYQPKNAFLSEVYLPALKADADAKAAAEEAYRVALEAKAQADAQAKADAKAEADAQARLAASKVRKLSASSQEKLDAMSDALYFMEQHPEVSTDVLDSLTNYMLEHGLRPTIENFEAALLATEE